MFAGSTADRSSVSMTSQQPRECPLSLSGYTLSSDALPAELQSVTGNVGNSSPDKLWCRHAKPIGEMILVSAMRYR